MYKYALVGNYVFSRNDGDRHFISAHQLLKLYGLRPAECLFTSVDRLEQDLTGYDEKQLIILWPRYDGNYQLPRSQPTR